MLIGDVSVLYGGNAEKGHSVGRRQKGLPLPCQALQELHLGNTAKPSPDAGTTTLLGGTKVQSEATMPPAGATPSQSPQQDLPWGRGWANSSTGTYMRTPYSPIDALPLTPPGKQLCRPSFFSTPRSELTRTPPACVPQLQGPRACTAAPAPPWEMPQIRVKILQKELEAQRDEVPRQGHTVNTGAQHRTWAS